MKKVVEQLNNDVLARLDVNGEVEVTLVELKRLEQHPRVVMIDFTGFYEEGMELMYDIQVTAEGTTKDSEQYDITVYPVLVKVYRGF